MEKRKPENILTLLASGTSWQIGRDKTGKVVLSLYATGKGEPLRLYLSSNTERTIWLYCHDRETK